MSNNETRRRRNRLRNAKAKLKTAETKLRRAEASIRFWRRRIADLTYESKSEVQTSLWTPSEHAEPSSNSFVS